MCGIAGIFSLNNVAPEKYRSALARMLDSMRHRGPDNRDQKEFSASGSNGSRLFLGHQRLSIIDLSERGHQPMGNESGSIWISTNSEIYNFRDLRDQLKLHYNFTSQSDTEVLLKSYEYWGVECLEKLRGMFAFSIWDSREQKLFLARDRLGIKPLYYYKADDVFIFASEFRALLASGLIPPKVDPFGIFQYLSFGRLGAGAGMVDGVQELPPAHFLVFDGRTGGIRLKEYWNPASNAADGENTSIEQIREKIKESIRLRLVSDVPIGSFLSGGIDSSVVTATMARFHDQPVKSLAVEFEEEEYDESEYSSLVARQIGVDHHRIKISETDLLDTLPGALSAMDLPSIDGINTYIISRAAREAGLTVVMSGLGGDELFAGYDSFRTLPALEKLNGLLEKTPNWIANSLAGLLSSSDRDVKLAHLLRQRKNGCNNYFLFRALFCESDLEELIVDSNEIKISLQKQLEITKNIINNIKLLDPVNQISYLELSQYMGNMLLRDADAMSMAHSLEIRVPLIDHELVELMFRIPGNQKLSPKTPKPLLIKALGQELPDGLVQRKKMGFTLPFEKWMRNELKNEMEAVLLSPLKGFDEMIQRRAVQNIWQRYLDGKTSWSRPWSLYVLKKWWDLNIQN